MDSALACRFISSASFRNRENTGANPEAQESPRADRALIIQTGFGDIQDTDHKPVYRALC